VLNCIVLNADAVELFLLFVAVLAGVAWVTK
jgi:hypothetical protein